MVIWKRSQTRTDELLFIILFWGIGCHRYEEELVPVGFQLIAERVQDGIKVMGIKLVLQYRHRALSASIRRLLADTTYLNSGILY